MSEGEKVTAMVTTRLRKRKVGERDVWDLIVKNDDISLTHIIPRLNATDIKFLYGVNSETRKLIKRSTRVDDLKENFKVREMSSISTLEFAWENREHKSLPPRRFSYRVAETNKLELLKWIREEKKCEWDGWTLSMAARQGNLEMVKYCVANKCPTSIDADACGNAAQNGHLECLKYLHEEVKAPWDSSTASRAALNGHLHILKYLVERKYDQYSALACRFAAVNGHLDCLKYLHEIAKAPWDKEVVRKAYETAKEPGKYLTARDAPETDLAECVQYLLDNDCPLPLGWRYEDGELHVPESDPE